MTKCKLALSQFWDIEGLGAECYDVFVINHETFHFDDQNAGRGEGRVVGCLR